MTRQLFVPVGSRARIHVTKLRMALLLPIQDASGATPWHLAAARGSGAVLRVFLDQPLQPPQLQPQRGATVAAATADPDSSQSVADAAASDARVLRRAVPVAIEARDGRGRTALHCAADCDAGPVVPLLLAAGADPAAVCGRGRTPLHCAAQGGMLGVMTLLLGRMAPQDVNRRVRVRLCLCACARVCPRA